MPLFATSFMVITLSSIGLPLTNGFVGEFLILLGAFRANPWFGVLAATGVVLGAIYMLWMLQRVFFGPIKNAANEALKDLSVREIAVFAPIIGLIFFMGVYPKPFLSRMEPAVNKFISEVKAKQTTLDNRSQAHQWIALDDADDDDSAEEEKAQAREP
jgi:NADH-quinone oxidoreductase subunit M